MHPPYAKETSQSMCVSAAGYLTAYFYAYSPERLCNPLKGSVHIQLPGLEF